MEQTHICEIRDADHHFVIDPITRSVTNSDSKKTKLMQRDHNSECLSFEIPRIIEEHDMSECNVVRIHYINNGSEGLTKGLYEVDDLTKVDGEDKVIFSWTISEQATQYAGPLSFIIEFKCINDESIAIYRWWTDINNSIQISSGINNEEYIVEEYADVIEQWKTELFSELSLIKEQIDNKIWQSDITTAVDGIDTDGRNLLKDGKLDKTPCKWLRSSGLNVNCDNGYTILSSDETGSRVSYYQTESQNPRLANFEDAKTYTMSIDVMKLPEMDIPSNSSFEIHFGSTANRFKVAIPSDLPENTWTRLTATTSDDFVPSGSMTARICVGSGAGGFACKNAELEGWASSLEYVDDKITSLNATSHEHTNKNTLDALSCDMLDNPITDGDFNFGINTESWNRLTFQSDTVLMASDGAVVRNVEEKEIDGQKFFRVHLHKPGLGIGLEGGDTPSFFDIPVKAVEDKFDLGLNSGGLGLDLGLNSASDDEIPAVYTLPENAKEGDLCLYAKPNTFTLANSGKRIYFDWNEFSKPVSEENTTIFSASYYSEGDTYTALESNGERNPYECFIWFNKINEDGLTEILEVHFIDEVLDSDNSHYTICNALGEEIEATYFNGIDEIPLYFDLPDLLSAGGFDLNGNEYLFHTEYELMKYQGGEWSKVASSNGSADLSNYYTKNEIDSKGFITADDILNGGGSLEALSIFEKNLILSLLKNAVYTNDVSNVIKSLESIWSGGEGLVCSITNNLPNANTSNSATSIIVGASYSATLTADEGYIIDSVAVSMGGLDITSTAYKGNGKINIEVVSGDISITAVTTFVIDLTYEIGSISSTNGENTTATNRVRTASIPYTGGNINLPEYAIAIRSYNENKTFVEASNDTNAEGVTIGGWFFETMRPNTIYPYIRIIARKVSDADFGAGELDGVILTVGNTKYRLKGV